MKASNSRSQRTLFNLVLHLQKKSKPEKGYIIVVVMGMILALSTMLVTAALTSKVDSNNSRASRNSAAGFYAAEAGLNLRAQDVRSKFAGYQLPGNSGATYDYSPTSSAACQNDDVILAGGNHSWGKGDFACDSTRTFQSQKVSTFVIDENAKDAAGLPIPSSITIGSGEDFAGLNAQEYRYNVSSVAYDNQNQPTSSLQMRFKSRLIPMFQFAAFYQNDLDLTRPAAMNLSGPIHTNGDLYLNSADPIVISGQLSSPGHMYRGEKDPSQTCNPSGGYTGTLSIKNPVSGLLLTMGCNGSPNAEITQGTGKDQDIYVGGTYVNKWQGAFKFLKKPLTIPPSSLIDAKLPDTTNKYDYWNKADLRIALRLDSSGAPVSIEVVNADQTTNSAATAILNGSSCLPTSTTLASSPSSYTKSSSSITVANGSSFPNGTPLRIAGSSFVDFDENVVANKASTNVLPLKRLLGMQDIASTSGVTVSKAIVWSSKTFFNYREKTLDLDTKTTAQQGRLIRMLNVDVQGIMNCANASSLMGGKSLSDDTEGGLVWYFTVIGPNSTVDVTKATPDDPNSYGVRLYNGATLGAGSTAIKGLTIATDQAVYVRGDYNSVNKKPAAILADSINVLSNSSPLDDSASCAVYNKIYDATDCTTTTDVTARATSDTTINAAFLAGVDITGTTAGDNSGGLNNYPRLHENWSGSIFTYRGSMVSLGVPRRVEGAFGNVGTTWNIYFAPSRNWDYDTDFNQAQNLPPLTPRFVYIQQERFSRDFNRSAFLSLPNFMASSVSNIFLSVIPSLRSTPFQF